MSERLVNGRPSARITAAQCFMDMAWLVAERATCPKLHVGAVLVSPRGTILSTGYNGAPRGVEHCTSVGCDGDAAGHCTRAVHAETNTIAQAALTGVKTEGAWLFVTHVPCLRCLNILINAGVKGVIYAEEYKNGGGSVLRAHRAKEGNIILAQQYALPDLEW